MADVVKGDGRKMLAVPDQKFMGFLQRSSWYEITWNDSLFHFHLLIAAFTFVSRSNVKSQAVCNEQEKSNPFSTHHPHPPVGPAAKTCNTLPLRRYRMGSSS